MHLEQILTKKYKKLLLIPIIILLASLFILGSQNAKYGYFIDKDISLKGGVTSTVYSENIDISDIESQFQEQFPNSDISIRELASITNSEKTGILIEASDLTAEEIRPFLLDNFNSNEFSLEEVGPALGQTFFRELMFALAFALVLMGIVVFITFRKLIPSLAVIFSAILDLVATLAIISLLGIKISSAGIAAFLMVIGYSIDTDILLTTKVLRNKFGTLYERIKSAFKTGITMTTTTFIALLIAFIFTNSATLKQMFGIILIALIIDFVSTWIMNTSLLVWYVKKNENKEST
jgi:preprotein translocase subunit SecF